MWFNSSFNKNIVPILLIKVLFCTAEFIKLLTETRFKVNCSSFKDIKSIINNHNQKNLTVNLRKKLF